MEGLSVDERCHIECGRIVKLLEENEGKIPVGDLSERYKETHKADLEHWKGAFVQFDSFIKYGCSGKLSIVGDDIMLSSQPKHNKAGSGAAFQVQYIAKPQFSQFFGFSERDRGKGVPYRVWRFEVESTMKEGLHSTEIIAEQIRRSLQGEAKSKVVGFALEMSLSDMLSQLDQFYKEDGGTTGDEMLAEAYIWKQAAHEEVAAFASRLDNQVRKAKVRGTDLLPDESAVDKQLRLLFWEGLKGSIKDKARHKKDQCTSFAELISAARYGEKEAGGNHEAKYVGRANQTVVDDPSESVEGIPDNPPKWFTQMYGSMLQEVKAVVSSPEENVGGQMPSTRGRRDRLDQRRSDFGKPPTCFRCGQLGHLQIGCRNPPKNTKPPSDYNTKGDSGNYNRSLMWGNQRS